jgi:hypothetical protein
MEAAVVGESGFGGGGRALCLAAQRHLQIWTRSGQCVMISFWVLLAMEVVVISESGLGGGGRRCCWAGTGTSSPFNPRSVYSSFATVSHSFFHVLTPWWWFRWFDQFPPSKQGTYPNFIFLKQVYWSWILNVADIYNPSWIFLSKKQVPHYFGLACVDL